MHQKHDRIPATPETAKQDKKEKYIVHPLIIKFKTFTSIGINYYSPG